MKNSCTLTVFKSHSKSIYGRFPSLGKVRNAKSLIGALNKLLIPWRLKHMIDMIDVCIVTRDPKAPHRNGVIKAIKRSDLPVGKLIIEVTRPLGMARKNAIDKVQTKWFAFIDDDVLIGRNWYAMVSKYINEDVGAIEGAPIGIGYGRKLDQLILSKALDEQVKELSVGERGGCCAVLIRTDSVRDWKPSRPDLSSLEDYEITQHILKKKLRWIRIRMPDTLHLQGWIKHLKNCMWYASGYKKLNKYKTISYFASTSKFCIKTIFYIIIGRAKTPLSFRILELLSNLAILLGLMIG